MSHRRWVTRAQLVELVNWWHMARGYLRCSENPEPTERERAVQAAKWFAADHPEVPRGGAYKDLVSSLEAGTTEELAALVAPRMSPRRAPR